MRPIPGLLFFLVTIAAAFGNEPGGGTMGPDVHIGDQGPNVVLDNGIIRATIVKDTAAVSSLRFHGQEMANTIYYSMDGGATYSNPRGCQYTVKTGTPDMADISLKSVWNNNRHQI